MASAQAAAASVSKPPSAYWLWLGDNREKIEKMVGRKAPEVAKKGGEMWKALSDAAKQPWEKQAKERKEAYEKFIATEEGKKALEEKKSASAGEKAEKKAKADAIAEKKAQQEEKRNDRACKAAVKAVTAEKDDKLKKPLTAYWLWLGDNREKIVKMVGTGNVSAVGKKGGEMWKSLSEAARQPWEKKAQEQKENYDKYIASAEGAAALKAFKDATQAAKDEFKPKAAPAAEGTADESTKKRKATEDAPAEKGASAQKRGRPSATAKNLAKVGA